MSLDMREVGHGVEGCSLQGTRRCAVQAIKRIDPDSCVGRL
jgi:hypothetical protein